MVIGDEEFVARLIAWMVEQRRPPNEAVRALLRSEPRMPADDIQLALIETALRMEEVYDQVCRDEWNDWQRIDYIITASNRGNPKRGGSSELLQLKSELYRIIAFIAIDVIQLQREERSPVLGADLLRLWNRRRSDYF